MNFTRFLYWSYISFANHSEWYPYRLRNFRIKNPLFNFCIGENARFFCNISEFLIEFHIFRYPYCGHHWTRVYTEKNMTWKLSKNGFYGGWNWAIQPTRQNSESRIYESKDLLVWIFNIESERTSRLFFFVEGAWLLSGTNVRFRWSQGVKYSQIGLY